MFKNGRANYTLLTVDRNDSKSKATQNGLAHNVDISTIRTYKQRKIGAGEVLEDHVHTNECCCAACFVLFLLIFVAFAYVAFVNVEYVHNFVSNQMSNINLVLTSNSHPRNFSTLATSLSSPPPSSHLQTQEVESSRVERHEVSSGILFNDIYEE